MRDVLNRRGLVALALALAASLAGDTLLAQAETPPAGAAPLPAEATAAEPEVVLDSIVVTAQKREEDIQKVPISITTFDAEQLRLLTAGGADVKFLSGRVPSLILESSFGRAFPRFYIRGLGNTDFDLNASQPVSMVVDEIVLENPVVKGMPLFDLERTEVLRGPQGTFFGRNTPAGVVKFDTVKPSQVSDGFFRASYGTFDNIDVQAAYGGAITETFSARASVLYQSQGDWVDNGFTGEKEALGGFDTTAARVQFLWEPNERLDALLNVHGWSLDGTARIFRANILKAGSNDLADDFDQDEVFQDGLNDQTIDAYGASFKLDYDFGGLTLTSVTGYETISKMYSRGDIDGGFGAVYA
ncbi:MAG: TonB-dependent receptor plug domain-containing protein, partial [Thermoanaerobaculia bacterium]|nr:TonB-dependent receptor plug domain-containing protein [Thermoanaerobaculia bacterium]